MRARYVAGVANNPTRSAGGNPSGTMSSASTHPAARPWLNRGMTPEGWRLRLTSWRNAMNSAVSAASSGATVSSASPGACRVTASPLVAGTIQPHSRCRMQIVEGFEFFPLTFDGRAKLERVQELSALRERVKSASATDAVFLAHGFRNDNAEATALYTKFLKTFRAQLSRPDFGTVAARRFEVAG